MQKTKIFIQADQSGAEALIVSFLCRNGRYRSLFLNGIKPHIYIALHLFHDTWAKIARMDIKTFDHIFLESPIHELKSIPGWSDIAKAIKNHETYYFIGKKTTHACVDDKTEVLTENGWISIKNITKENKIASWESSSHFIKFENPLETFEYDYNGDMIYLDSPELNQLVTPNHKMCYYSNNKDKECDANYVLNNKSLRIPNNGIFKSQENILNFSSSEIKLLVAIQADGCIRSKHTILFRFKKERKINRLINILNNLNINYRYKHTDISNIYIPCATKFINFFEGTKVWNKNLLKLSSENIKVFCNELKYWDGTYSPNNREAYFSKHKINIEWVKTLLHLNNQQGTFYKPPDNIYHIGINSRQYSRIFNISKIHFTGKVYCLTTSTGFFIIRREGKISVTGNSSYGMRTNTFIFDVLKESEGKIVLSKQEAEKFLGTFHSLFPEIQQDFHINVQKQIRATSTLYNLQGFPRLFNSFYTDDFKDAYAFIPQSTVGTITNIAFTNMQKKIENENLKDWDLLINCHDSVLMQCHEENKEVVALALKESLEQSLVNPSGESFKMKAEVSAGYNWSKFHETKNPEGLKEFNI